jgi:hypothetical protein
MAQHDCGSTPFCTCGANTTLPVEKQASVVIYQLTGKKVTVFQAAPPLVTPGTSVLVNSKSWVARADSSGNISEIPSNSTLQVSATSEKNSVTIDPMNEHVSGIQLFYTNVIVLNDADRTVRRYDSPWITALVGIVPSVKAPSYVSSKANCSINVTIDVGGIPTTNLSLMRNGVDVRSDRYQLDHQLLTLGPVKDSDTGNYTIRASNCFDSASANFHLDVLTPASIVTMTIRRDSNLCGYPATLKCVARGYPKPTITWMVNNTRLHPSSKLHIEETHHDGDNYFHSSLRLDNVLTDNIGVYNCTARNNVSQGCNASEDLGKETMDFKVSCIGEVPGPVYNISYIGNDTVTLVVIFAPGQQDLVKHFVVITDDGKTVSTTTVRPAEIPVVIRDLRPKTKYSFSLKAVYIDNRQSETSTPKTVTTEGPPGAISALVDVNFDCNAIRFDVVRPIDDGGNPVDGYRVYRSVGIAGNESIENMLATTGQRLRVSLEGLPSGTCVAVRIRARNKYGYGDYSRIYNLRTNACSKADSSVTLILVVGVLAALLCAVLLLAVYCTYRWRRLSDAMQASSDGKELRQLSGEDRVKGLEDQRDFHSHGEALTCSPVYEATIQNKSAYGRKIEMADTSG